MRKKEKQKNRKKQRESTAHNSKKYIIPPWQETHTHKQNGKLILILKQTPSTFRYQNNTYLVVVKDIAATDQTNSSDNEAKKISCLEIIKEIQKERKKEREIKKMWYWCCFVTYSKQDLVWRSNGSKERENERKKERGEKKKGKSCNVGGMVVKWRKKIQCKHRCKYTWDENKHVK